MNEVLATQAVQQAAGQTQPDREPGLLARTVVDGVEFAGEVATEMAANGVVTVVKWGVEVLGQCAGHVFAGVCEGIGNLFG